MLLFIFLFLINIYIYNFFIDNFVVFTSLKIGLNL